MIRHPPDSPVCTGPVFLKDGVPERSNISDNQITAQRNAPPAITDPRQKTRGHP